MSEVLRKTMSLPCRASSGFCLLWEGISEAVRIMGKNPAGTGNFVIANLLCCLVLWLMDIELFFGTKTLPNYRLLTLLRVSQSAVPLFDKMCCMAPAEWRLLIFRVLLSWRASLLFRMPCLSFGT